MIMTVHQKAWAGGLFVNLGDDHSDVIGTAAESVAVRVSLVA